jgi:hypothetical protein
MSGSNLSSEARLSPRLAQPEFAGCAGVVVASAYKIERTSATRLTRTLQAATRVVQPIKTCLIEPMNDDPNGTLVGSWILSSTPADITRGLQRCRER